MKKIQKYTGVALLLSCSISLAHEFHIKRGEGLSDLDKINIEWKKQSGHCPTKFPVESVHCSYTYANIKGLAATYINHYSVQADFRTENTYLLNISIPGDDITKSCQLLQEKIQNLNTIIINKTGCVIK